MKMKNLILYVSCFDETFGDARFQAGGQHIWILKYNVN